MSACAATRAESRKTACHPEIEQFHLSRLREHHVLGLDVAVQNASLVRGRKRIGTLDGDVEKLIDVDGLVQALPQRLPFHVLHDQEDFAVLFQDVIHAGNVRVIQRRKALPLAEQARRLVGTATSTN